MNNVITVNQTISTEKVMRLEGRLDAASASLQNRYLAECLRTSEGTVILNLADVEFIDSTGLGQLVSFQQMLEKRDRRLVICEATEQARLLFELTRLNQIFDLFDTEDRAVQSA